MLRPLRRIIGQGRVIDEILMTLLAGGHALVVGVPGLVHAPQPRKKPSSAPAYHYRSRCR